ncbi:MAG: hypothetical protein HKN79_04250 [Flavobacteriales bacterium]|nr:hypothetical protein [Flavobacteriales bacterium]
MTRIPLFLIFILLSSSVLCQSNSTDSSYLHSPKKATLLSTALPGAGQVYNKKYWKLPIIYGGFALSIYYLNDNLDNIRYFKNNLIAIQDDDPNTVNETSFTSTQLNDIIDQYKNWRDLSYLAIGAIYGLQILDAHVDAHLFYFDVDEDLSMQVMPFVSTSSPGVGLHLALQF